MTISTGSVVRAKAGRDKDGFFLVIRTEGNFAFIADGRRRKVDNPKKKKLIHLQATNTMFEDSMVTNRIIREFLRKFNEDIL